VRINIQTKIRLIVIEEITLLTRLSQTKLDLDEFITSGNQLGEEKLAKPILRIAV